MKRVPILGLVKLQLCLLTLVMLFCKINGVRLSISYYIYYFLNLGVVVLSSMFCPTRQAQQRTNFDALPRARPTLKRELNMGAQARVCNNRETIKMKRT